jgi:hypothetical protein
VNEDTIVKIVEKVYAAQARAVARIAYEDIGGPNARLLIPSKSVG